MIFITRYYYVNENKKLKGGLKREKVYEKSWIEK